MSRMMTPMSDFTSDNGSTDKATHSGETEGKSSHNRKADEMEESDDETPRTPATKRGSANGRGETRITVAEREKRKQMTNRGKKVRTKAKRARVRRETEERTLDPQYCEYASGFHINFKLWY